jgi:hypothetical protein
LSDEAVSVKLGPRTFQLVEPTSMAVAADILDGYRRSRWRAYGAALGVTAPRLTKLLKVPDLAACGFDVGVFGGRILDALRAEGVSLEEIGAAGGQAYTLVAGSLIEESEVAAVEGFSAPPTDSSTSS